MSLRRSMALLLWVGIVAAGCGSTPADGPPKQPVPVVNSGALNFIHAVPDATALDVFIDGKKAISGLEYRTSSGNLATAPGAHKLEVRLAGSDESMPPLWTNSVYLQEAQKILLTAVGRLAETVGTTKLNVVAQPFGIADRNELRLRFLHAAPGAPTLDIKQDARAMWKGVAFGRFGQTYALGAGVTAVDLKLSLYAADATDALGQLMVKGSYRQGSVYTLISFGEANPLIEDARFFGFSVLDEDSGTLSELPLTIGGAGPKASLYVFHASSDTQGIDIYAENGARLCGGLAFDGASPLLELMPGPYKVQVRAAGTLTVLATATLKLLPATQWAVYLTGLRPPAMPGRGLALYAAPMAKKGQGKTWRLIHAVPDAGLFDLKNNGPTLFGRLGYAHDAPYRQDPLPSGTLQLQLTADPTKLWSVAVPQTVADSVRGEVTTIFVTGSSANPAQPLLAVALVESSATTTRAPTLMPLSTTK